MKTLSIPITEAFRRLKENNPGKKLALLPIGVWIQMQDFRWQAVIQKGDDGVYRVMEKDDPKMWVSAQDFVKDFLPGALEFSWQIATNN